MSDFILLNQIFSKNKYISIFHLLTNYHKCLLKTLQEPTSCEPLL